MDRTAARREALRRSLRDDESRPDAILVTAPANVRYLSGFTGSSAALIVTATRDVLLSDGRYVEQLARECPGLDLRIRRVDQVMTDNAVEAIRVLGLGRVAIESATMTVAEFETIRGTLETTALAPTSGRVEALRSIKDDEEVAAIREAVAIAERAFADLCVAWRSGDSEKEAADALEGLLRRRGAEAASFPPIVAAGAHSALPHASPSADSRIGDADFVLVDWGAAGPGTYKSDLTRVVVTGKVAPAFEEVYRVVHEAQARAIAAIRPGAMARDVDAAARGHIASAGHGAQFNHGLGHGLGLEIHEAPFFRASSDAELRPGMVVTVEPGVYLPGWGGVRIEDDVLVTGDGHEVLSRLPKSLDDVRSAAPG